MTSKYTATTAASELAQDLKANITGKVILTTGISPNGLGAVFVQAIAEASPSLLILAGRDPQRIQTTATELQKQHPNLKLRTLQLDLGSLEKVRIAAKEVNSWDDVSQIDVLVNNAAVMATKFSLSPDGIENQFATNHIGPFLFTNLIMNKILAAPKPRIVNVSSDGHRMHPIRFLDHNFQNGELYNKWFAYGQSKTANMLMALSLAERLGAKHNLVALSLHPGVIATNLGQHVDWTTETADLNNCDKLLGNSEGWGSFAWKTPDQGAATHVYAAFHPELDAHNGAYLQDCQVADPWIHTVKPWATNSIEAAKLWKLSQELVNEVFEY